MLLKESYISDNMLLKSEDIVEVVGVGIVRVVVVILARIMAVIPIAA